MPNEDCQPADRDEFDALEALRDGSALVDMLSPAKRAVFAGLNRAEVDLLIRLRERLEAVAGEVTAQEVKVF